MFTYFILMYTNKIVNKPEKACMVRIIPKTDIVLLLKPNAPRTFPPVIAININVKIKISLIYKN